MSNSVTVAGNLTRDPELKYTPSGAAVVKFGLAVNRSYTNRNGDKVEQTSFVNVSAWASLAENVAESLHVGDRVIVNGRLESHSWETEEGQKRSTIEIQADEVGPSIRWATVTINKTKRTGPGEWGTESVSETQEQEVSAGTP
ncbi:MAG: single-stranded DNA-binding protein [Actinomycetota bacterium]